MDAFNAAAWMREAERLGAKVFWSEHTINMQLPLGCPAFHKAHAEQVAADPGNKVLAGHLQRHRPDLYRPYMRSIQSASEGVS